MSISLKHFKCPSCGSDMYFDVQEQLVICKTCGHKSIIAANVSIDAEVNDIADAQCPNCGGVLSYDPATQNATCSFCNTGYVAIDTTKLKYLPQLPDYISLFKVNKDDAKRSFLAWLNRGQYTPEDIFDSDVKEVTGVYIPVWRFDLIYKADYSASIGYDRQETYTDYESYWEDVPYQDFDSVFVNGNWRRVPVTKYRREERKRPVTKTRTVTDWSAYSGTVSGEITIKAKAVKNFVFLTNEYSNMYTEVDEEKRIVGARKNEDISFSALPDYCADNTGTDGIAFQDKYLAGYKAIRADIDYNDALTNKIKEGAISDPVFSKIRSITPGDHIKDISYNMTQFDEEHNLMARPFWEMVYEYNNKTYVAFTSGTVNWLTNGTKPYDNLLAKLKLKFRLFLGFGISLLGIGVIALLLGYFHAFDTGYSLAAYIVFGVVTVLGVFGTCSGIDAYMKIRKGRQKESDLEKIKNNLKLFFKDC